MTPNLQFININNAHIPQKTQILTNVLYPNSISTSLSLSYTYVIKSLYALSADSIDPDTIDSIDSDSIGSIVGLFEGLFEGLLEGIFVGLFVGLFEGLFEGLLEGIFVGL
eukprot:226512_1